MKWKIACVGDRKEKTFFALLPLECEDGKTRWLCRLRGIWQFQPNYSEFPAIPCWCLIECYPLEKSARAV